MATQSGNKTQTKAAENTTVNFFLKPRVVWRIKQDQYSDEPIESPDELANNGNKHLRTQRPKTVTWSNLAKLSNQEKTRKSIIF